MARKISEIMLRGGWTPETATQVASGEGCRAGKDGDCIWKDCPQNRDGEPMKNGRHCPLDNDDGED